jgi:hypothetical protein
MTRSSIEDRLADVAVELLEKELTIAWPAMTESTVKITIEVPMQAYWRVRKALQSEGIDV